MSKNSIISINNLYFYEDSTTKKRAVRWMNISRTIEYRKDKPFSLIGHNYQFHFDENSKLHGECFYRDDNIELTMTVNKGIIESLILNGKIII